MTIVKNTRKKNEKKFFLKRNIFYICYRLKQHKIKLKSMNLSTLIKRITQRLQSPNEVIKIGNTYLVDGKEVVIIDRHKSDLQLRSNHTQNNYRAYVGEASNGQRMYIQLGDIACPVRQLKGTIKSNA